MWRGKRKKKGPVRAKKTVVDGISFSSGLEAYMYKALKQANIKAKYEGKTYEVIHRTLWELALSSNVRVDPMSLFLYVGSYLKLTLSRIYQRLNFTNHKIRKNATRR